MSKRKKKFNYKKATVFVVCSWFALFTFFGIQALMFTYPIIGVPLVIVLISLAVALMGGTE